MQKLPLILGKDCMPMQVYCCGTGFLVVYGTGFDSSELTIHLFVHSSPQQPYVTYSRNMKSSVYWKLEQYPQEA